MKWSVVKGLVMAVVATVLRLGWHMESPHSAVDDTGATWNFKMDPPAAIKKAVKQSSRRWRLQQISLFQICHIDKINNLRRGRLYFNLFRLNLRNQVSVCRSKIKWHQTL